MSALLSSESAHKLLILAGESVEESGDLLFHRGLFSPQQLKQILTEQVQQHICVLCGEVDTYCVVQADINIDT